MYKFIKKTDFDIDFPCLNNASYENINIDKKLFSTLIKEYKEDINSINIPLIENEVKKINLITPPILLKFKKKYQYNWSILDKISKDY